MTKTKRMLFLSMLVSVGAALQIFESFLSIPFVVPWAKLGLANIVNLVTIILLGYKYAVIIAVLRSILGAVGSGAITGLFYSLTGALVSSTIMWFVYKSLSRYFSLIGVSIFGAVSHNIAQLLVASIMIGNGLIFSYLPIMMLVSLITGYFVGISSIYASRYLKVHFSQRV